MKRLQYSLLATTGILVLAFTLNLAGPQRVMAALGFTPVRDVDQPARHPVQLFGFMNGTSSALAISYVVPDGKRLVVETISGSIHHDPGQIGYLQVDNRKDLNVFAVLTIPAANVGITPTGFTKHAVTQQVRLYADPGTLVEVMGLKNGGQANSFFGDASLVGYLVDLP